MAALENPIDTLLPVIGQAIAEWQQINTAEKVSANVKTLLDKQSQQITLKLLGFDKSYDGWVLDHCNNRSGNSAAGDFLRKTQAEAIKEWLSTVTLPTLGDELKAALQKSAQKEYEHQISRKIRELTIQHAERTAKALVEAVATSNHIDNYIKMMRLIDQNQ